MPNGPSREYRAAHAVPDMWAAAMKRDPDRGVVGAWARRSRIDAGFTSTERAAAAAKRAGIDVSPAYLRGIESGGHKPSRELVVALAGFYRAPPPTEATEADRWMTEVRDAVTTALDSRLAREERLLARLEQRLARLELLLERRASDPSDQT